MTFFARERASQREESKHAFDYNQHYNDMLNGLNGEFTFGGNSGFRRSPLEIFRMNVEKFCGGFVRVEGQDTTDEREMSMEHKRNGKHDLHWEHHEGHNQEYAGENINSQYPERDSCNFESDVICRHCQVQRTESDSIISVMSVSFEPFETQEPEKPSLLKKLTSLMNSNFNARQEKMTISQSILLKQRAEPRQWNACECQVHIGKHSSCCQCQEPYHRMNCECVQHNGSHSYCCRCDPHLLQEYDQHLKKKRYLRLLSDDEELSPVNSFDHRDGGIPGFRTEPPSANAASLESSGRKQFLKNTKIPPLSRPGTGDRPCTDRDEDTAEPDSHQPCESCCKRLDTIYGTALREVHSMLMDVSRTLLPSAHCCSLESRIQNVSRWRPAAHGPRNLETVESNEAEPEWKGISATTEFGVQVTPKDISREQDRKRKPKIGKRIKNKCTIS